MGIEDERGIILVDLLELKDHIKNNDFQRFYILYGEEYLIKHKYIEMISQHQNRDVEYYDRFADIKDYLNVKSALLPSKCYVVYDDNEFTKSENAWTILDHMSNKNTVIFLYNALDTKTKFYKYYKNNCVKFEKLSPTILSKYIIHDYELSLAHTNDLIERCDADYGRIYNCGKLINYLSEVNEITKDRAYEILINESQIPLPSQSMEKQIVDAVMRDSLRNAYKLYEQAKDNINALYLVISLYNNFKHLLLVQSCQDDGQKDIPKKTGLESWEVKRISNYIGYFAIRDIVWALKTLRYCENGLKNGLLADTQLIPYFFTQMI